MVSCGNCGAENPSGHSFCSSCGNALTRECPNCGTSNEPGNRFCFSCGTALAGDAALLTPTTSDAPTSDAGERRLVSVVFADLVGFTSFSESRDPEDVRNMLTHYYEQCREIIGRYGGTTDKFIGDAVMGVWGAVEAHEDDAERSTRAALELVDMVAGLGSDLGIADLAARAGVLSGEASVGSGGNEHGLVVGDLVNTASRLQSIAPPGGVFVGESTRDLAGHTIEFVPVGEHQVKGKEIPVAAFQAVRVIALSTARRGGDLAEGPFVGREDELRILKDQLHATGREGRARMISLVGEGGIGKTRLSQELVRYIDGITENIYYHSGRSPSYGDGVTFWALGEMIRHRAGIQEGEDPSKSRLKLRTTVADFCPDEEDQRWIEPRLAAIIGLSAMPPGERPEMFAALRAFFQAISTRGTVLMVFEDLHWADDGLLDFIEELVERTTQHPILVLSLARPELLERRSDWGTGQKRTLSMHLSRLDQGSMERLVAGLAPGIPDETAARIAARTAGVPLHAVEFVRMLVNSGQLTSDNGKFTLTGDIADLSIPDSVNAIISARIDRLDQNHVALIQDASVLGLSFTVSDLAQLRGTDIDEVSAMLRDLVRRDIFELDDDPRSPERGQYLFVQGLIREVAYGRLSRSERVSRHLEVARQFEAQGDIELAGAVAAHYASAANADPDNADLQERARQAVIGAAERAADLHSDQQAFNLYEQAISMTPDPAEAAALRVAASSSVSASGRPDLAVEMAEQALDWYTEAGDTAGVARAATQVSFLLAGEFDAAKAVDAILPVFESTPQSDDPVWARLASETSRALMLAGRAAEAIAVADQAIPVLESRKLVPDLLDVLINKGTALGNLGRWLEGGVILRGAAAAAKEYELTLVAARALNNFMASSEDDNQNTIDLVEEVLALVTRSGDQGWAIRLGFFGPLVYLSQGNLDRARQFLTRRPEQELSEFWEDQYTFMELIIAEELSSDVPAEDDPAMVILERYRESDDPQLADAVLRFKLELLFNRGEYDEVLDLAMQPSPQQFAGYPFGEEVAVMAAALTGNSSVIDHVAESLGDMSRRGRATRGLSAHVRALAAALDGDVEHAVAAYMEASEIWEEVKEPFSVAQMNAVFARVMPSDNPVAIEAGRSAVRFFEESGLVRQLAVLAAPLVETARDDQDLAV